MQCYTNGDEVPHSGRLSDDRGHDAAPRAENHQFDGVIVDEVVQDSHC